MSTLNIPPKETIELVAQHLQIDESFVEKDWYIVQVIAALSNLNDQNFELIFAGGTSLSKAHRLIQRFSEDLDFRIHAPISTFTRKMLSTFKKEIVKNLHLAGFHIEEKNIKARNNNKFIVIEIFYASQFERRHHLRAHIQIEISAEPIQLSPIYLPVASFIAELMEKPHEVAKMGCLAPIETAANKLSAIVWRIPDRIRGSQGDDPFMVRHIHDLAILSDIVLKSPHFCKLAEASMHRDRNRAKNKTFHALTLNQKCELMLNILQEDPEYPKEYERFVKGVSYANDDLMPGFSSALEILKKLCTTFIKKQAAAENNKLEIKSGNL